MQNFRILWRTIRVNVPQPSESTTQTRRVGAMVGKYYLWATNIVGSGMLMSIGDLISQKIEHRNDTSTPTNQIDWTRNAKMFLVGAALGPLHHGFYGRLKCFVCGGLTKITGEKILCDQMLLAPPYILAIFYLSGRLNKKNIRQSSDEIQTKFKRVYITDWMVWPATKLINFYYFPPKYQAITVHFVTMMYNAYLSHVIHEDKRHADIEFLARKVMRYFFTPVKCLGRSDESPESISVMKKKFSDSNINISMKYNNQDVPIAGQALILLVKFIDIYTNHKEAIDAAIDRHQPLLKQILGDNVNITMNLDKDYETMVPLVMDFLMKCVELYNQHEKGVDETIGRLAPLVEEIMEISTHLYEDHGSEIYAAIVPLLPLMDAVGMKLDELEKGPMVVLTLTEEDVYLSALLISLTLICLNV